MLNAPILCFISHALLIICFAMEDANTKVIFLACGNLEWTSEDRYLYNERVTSVLEVPLTLLKEGGKAL